MAKIFVAQCYSSAATEPLLISIMISIEEGTPLFQMTAGQFVKLIEQTLQHNKPEERETDKEFVYGLDGLMALFGIKSKKHVIQLKNTILAPAVSQVGRTIITDKREALRLFAEHSTMERSKYEKK